MDTDGPVGVYVEVLDPAHQFAQHHACLQPGEIGAEAEVATGAEAEGLPQLGLVAVDVEPGRRGEHPPAPQRAALGGSPGDDTHAEPYLYVAPWAGAPDDPFFAESAFRGATLGYDALVAAPDAKAAALAFWREAYRLLQA